MDQILSHFPSLTDHQKDQFASLKGLYEEWNSKINVISRKDIDQLYLHHVLHSLVIAKFIQFRSSTKILDLGTGGGFPGIPLAILFPEVKFHLIDARQKKVYVVNEIIEAIKLDNCNGEHIRVEDIKGSYDYVLARAVAKIEQLVKWSYPIIHENHKNSTPNGLIALKGGDLTEEIKTIKKKHYYEVIPISNYLKQEYFASKYLVYVQK